MHAEQSEASFDSVDRPSRPSRAPRLAQRLAQALSAPGEDFTVALLSEASTLLKRLRDELSDGPRLDAEDANFVRRGLACAGVSVRLHEVVGDLPELCVETGVLLVALAGLATQHVDPTLPSDALSSSAEQIAERARCNEEMLAADLRLRGWPLAERMGRRRAAREAFAEAAAGTEALFQPLRVAVRLEHCDGLLRRHAAAVFAAWGRVERMKLVVDADDGEFDALGAAQVDERERLGGVRALLRTAASEMGQMRVLLYSNPCALACMSFAPH